MSAGKLVALADVWAMLDAWARRLHQIMTGEPASKVIPLRSA